MKIKELIAQLSEFDKEAEIELLYSFHTESADGNNVHVRVVEKNFTVVPHVENMDEMQVNSVLLATSTSLLS